MTLGRTVSLALFCTLAACGDDETPLQVQMQWVTFCDGGGCPTTDRELTGKPGDTIPNVADPEAEVGVRCEIVEQGDTVVATSIKVQNRDAELTSATEGINIRNGGIHVNSSMTCPDDAFVLLDDNAYTGTCGNAEDGSCQILITDYKRSNGRLVFEFDCTNLRFAGEMTRSVRDGLATFEGCSVTEDNR